MVLNNEEILLFPHIFFYSQLTEVAEMNNANNQNNNNTHTHNEKNNNNNNNNNTQNIETKKSHNTQASVIHHSMNSTYFGTQQQETQQLQSNKNINAIVTQQVITALNQRAELIQGLFFFFFLN